MKNIILATSILLCGCKMNSHTESPAETFSAIKRKLPEVSVDYQKNTCPKSYDGGKLGGCFVSATEDVDLVKSVLPILESMGLVPINTLRQDYLAYTMTFKQPKTDVHVAVYIRSLTDATPETPKRWGLKNEGYKSELVLETYSGKS